MLALTIKLWIRRVVTVETHDTAQHSHLRTCGYYTAILKPYSTTTQAQTSSTSTTRSGLQGKTSPCEAERKTGFVAGCRPTGQRRQESGFFKSEEAWKKSVTPTGQRVILKIRKSKKDFLFKEPLRKRQGILYVLQSMGKSVAFFHSHHRGKSTIGAMALSYSRRLPFLLQSTYTYIYSGAVQVRGSTIRLLY